ncbi:MAG: hypothetical protein CMF49_03245 [Legionellales bacterium]|nr:hypothetical protein [Legionellales bacterium]|tara:strand:+ start:288 stop:1127 length:840 start_codon:yes stop_codon:yes gene_type:complete
MLLSSNFYAALSSSFWIIPREGTEALLVIIMLVSALKASGREQHISVIYKNCIGAIILGLCLALGCVWLHSIFTGQVRELSEAFASLMALGMLLYVNFDTFAKNDRLHLMSLASLGFMAFISVFRELSEVILFYYGLFQGGISQQLGTFVGLIVGCFMLAALLYTYKISTQRWKVINKIIFNLTPFFIFMLAVMCIGNAVNAFQEARWLGFTPLSHMFNSQFLHAQASREYALALGIFLACTAPLFLKQFIRSFVLFFKWLATVKVREKLSHTTQQQFV